MLLLTLLRLPGGRRGIVTVILQSLAGYLHRIFRKIMSLLGTTHPICPLYLV